MSYPNRHLRAVEASPEAPEGVGVVVMLVGVIVGATGMGIVWLLVASL